MAANLSLKQGGVGMHHPDPKDVILGRSNHNHTGNIVCKEKARKLVQSIALWDSNTSKKLARSLIQSMNKNGDKFIVKRGELYYEVKQDKDDGELDGKFLTVVRKMITDIRGKEVSQLNDNMVNEAAKQCMKDSGDNVSNDNMLPLNFEECVSNVLCFAILL